ncbi:MAG: hypothetical protein AAFX79_03890 [Planctomycetota bacterium]
MTAAVLSNPRVVDPSSAHLGVILAAMLGIALVTAAVSSTQPIPVPVVFWTVAACIAGLIALFNIATHWPACGAVLLVWLLVSTLDLGLTIDLIVFGPLDESMAIGAFLIDYTGWPGLIVGKAAITLLPLAFLIAVVASRHSRASCVARYVGGPALLLGVAVLVLQWVKCLLYLSDEMAL